MPDRSRNPDPNQLAKSIVDQLTGSAPRQEEPATPPAASEPEKNPAAVALGRLGGKKGGPARAKALSKAKRAAIAKKAAKARWTKR
jgi:hypothetical protein